MVMTDMPAADECRSGALLAGEAGQLFDRMMAAIERDRNSLYLAALSCFRSPDGRFTSQAAVQCADLARHHVGPVQPRALLPIGDACSKAILGLPMAQATGLRPAVDTHPRPTRTLGSLHSP